ncbi:hypothetical protein JOC74_002752 [Bacillus capparidis]|uniref:Uncharacterized protein n=1 Tax=Bacillus capparidis TaxID=1840411 RepID=A0ABS4CY21_9BACI|nr:hypothetical protein [Bacillus capparidis]
MDHLLKGLLGSWIQAIGTVLSAIGSTPLQGVDEEFLNNLNLGEMFFRQPGMP